MYIFSHFRMYTYTVMRWIFVHVHVLHVELATRKFNIYSQEIRSVYALNMF